jgi:hypothetical protein
LQSSGYGLRRGTSEFIFEYGVFIIFGNAISSSHWKHSPNKWGTEREKERKREREREREREYKAVGWHGGSGVQFGFGKVAYTTVGYCCC